MWDQHAYRRHLAHFQNAYRIYFVTFTTLKRSVLPPVARGIVLEEIGRAHYILAFVHAGVVMPDHVHLVAQPLWTESGGLLALSEVLRRLKGRSSRFINTKVGRSGPLWLDENFDHQLRFDDSLTEKIDYVLPNPVRKGLAKTPDEYPWIWRWWVEGKNRTG